MENNIELNKESGKQIDYSVSWSTVMVSVLISLVFSLSALAIYSKFLSPKIYTIKIDEILADHIKTIGSANITDEQKQQMAVKWSEAFEESVNELYSNKNVVLTQQAVVQGGMDYTSQLKKEIQEKIDNKSGVQ